MDSRYSFTDLFSKEVDKDRDTRVKVSSVVIPQIQRPYAQGRTDEVSTYIRNTFLDEIFESLSKDEEEIFDLNFIYGVIKPNNDKYKMELLDGQQRLTTLFLLYWYITNAELDWEESLFVRRECLSKFTYETRATSTVFCQKLAYYKVELGEKRPKEVIRNAKWYFKSFDRDSTISAMLTMLDAIHERYTKLEKKSLFGRLQNLQFYVKSLGMFNLSEDLYIKMNARGLQLSPFENFKADLTNFVSSEKYEPFCEMVSLYKKGADVQVPFHFNFSVKLDAKWVDIFWRNGNGAVDYDASYMSFFSRFFACKYIVSSKDDVSDRDMRTDETIRFFYTNADERIGKNEYWGFKAFEALLGKHPEYVVTLSKVLDVLHQFDCKSTEKVIYKNMLPVWEKKSDSDGDDFYCNTSVRMSHVRLIALSALIEFVEAMDDFDVTTFERWMRVVWNVIENTNIDNLTPVSSLVRKFSMIIRFVAGKMKEGDSFYGALSLYSSEERESRAVIEEVEKARRIAEDENWEDVWKGVEKHPFFKGMVTFFYSVGMSQENYLQNAEMAKGMFDVNGISEDYRDEHILIRAIVSRFNTWDDINERYITENAETNKHLKNILASNEKVRSMLADVTSKGGKDEVKAALQSYIDKADDPQWPYVGDKEKEALGIAMKRLRHDAKMYDLAFKEEQSKGCFHIYWFCGHINFAVPRKWYARIIIDTERAEMAGSLCKDYAFCFSDDNQKKTYEQYGDCLGLGIMVEADRAACQVRLEFERYHELRIFLQCETPEYAEKLLNTFKESKLVEWSANCIQLPSLYYSTKAKTYKEICRKVDEIFKVIP